MAFNRPTLSQIIERILTDIASRLQTGKLLVNSFLAILGTALAGVSHGLHAHISWAARQLMPDTADGDYALRWGRIWGINQKAASYAQGYINLTGSSGAGVPINSVLQRADGKQYTTQAAVTIVLGVATVLVIANDAGVSGNLAAGSTLSFTSPVPGVATNALVDVGGIIDGSDIENPASVTERTLDRIKEPPQGGADHDYKNWAKSISGITRAFVYPNQYGLGSVGVAVVTDDAASPIPSGPKIAEVQVYIDTVRPTPAEVIVWGPTAHPVNFTIALVPNDAATKAEVEASLKEMIRREAEPGKTILLSKIREAVSIAAGENDNTITVPAANVTVPSNEMATFGAITWV